MRAEAVAGEAAWRLRAPLLLLIPVLALGLLPGPALLGIWESLTFYHAFGAVEAPLSFLIAPRANIGGQGYALLEMARTLVLDLGLPLNLATFRIPAVVAGMASLALFFVIGRRYFGGWPALGATALLAANPVFFQMQHTMTVAVITGAALLFVVERLQALEYRYWDAKAWLGLSVALALAALHYGPGRIFAVMLVGLWFAKAFWMFGRAPGGRAVRRGVVKVALYAAVACLLLLALLDFRNLASVLRFSSFLFPTYAETMEFTPNAAGEGGFLKMLTINLQVMLESLSGFAGEFHSRFASYVLADLRFPLLDTLVVPFVLLGLGVCLLRASDRTALLATPWGSVLAFFAVCAVPILTSSVLFRDGGPLATLSMYRMYFCLFPLHLLAAAALHWLGTVHKAGRLAGAFGVTAVFVTLVAGLVTERSRFETRVYTADWQKQGPEILKIWDDGMPNRERRGRDSVSHLQQHAQYANVAKEIAGTLGAGKGVRRIVYVDANRFTEAPIAPVGLHYITNRNFHAIFLALYAGEAGVQLKPVVMVDPGRKPISPDLMGGLAYRGKPREYSALTELDAQGRLSYKRGQPIVPVIVDVTGASVWDILVTTSEEEAGARSLMEKQGVPFEVVRP